MASKRHDGDYKVSRILLDGSVSATFHSSFTKAERDFKALDGWPKIECHYATMMYQFQDTWIIIEKYQRSIH